MMEIKRTFTLIIFFIIHKLSVAQCCGNGICEPGENASNCPYDCASTSYNCGNTIGSFYSSPSWPVSFSTAQSNGWCYTLNPPYPSQVCFEYRVPNVGDSASVSFSINACGGTTVNQSNYPPGGGCNNSGYSSSTILGVSTYDNNCNQVSNFISTGGPGCYNPGDIITVCIDINTSTSCSQITICPVIACGQTNCSTNPTTIGCPPFNLTDTAYITPCDTTSGVAIVTPDCGNHFTYLWDDPLAQTDSMAVGLTPGTYNVIVTNTAFGCDTTISVQVPNTSGSFNATIDSINPVCENAPSFNLTAVDPGGIWNGMGIVDSINGTFDPNIVGPGIHMVTYSFNGNCGDSDTINIEVLPISSSFSSISICQGDSIFLAGNYQTTSGIYYDTLQNALGCDSISQINLNVIPSIIIQVTDSICQGDSIYIGGSFQYSSGIYYDTLISISGCDSIIETILQVNSLPIVSTSSDTTICNGNYAVISASGGISYSWNNGIGQGQTHNVYPSTTTTYIVTATNSSGCSDTGSVTVFVEPFTLANAGIDQMLCNNADSFYLSANQPLNSGEIGIWYSDFGGFINNPSSPTTSGYGLNLGANVFIWTISNGICPQSSDTVVLNVENCDSSIIIIPNVFTPNGDGINDVFTIKSNRLTSLKCEIYNRWGQKLYEWDTVNGSWDGRTTAGEEAPEGTYFYIIHAVGTDNKEYSKNGSFTLIR